MSGGGTARIERHEHHDLLRVLGLAFGIAVVVGGVIGQGILRAPGLVASGVPDPRWIIALWALGGVIVFVDAMSSVELASSIRRAGGPYSFAYRAFGPLAGFITGVVDWLANVGTIAFVGVVFGEYLHRLGILASFSLGTLAAGLAVTVGAVHLFGTKVGGQSQNIGSAIKAVLFGILIVALMLAPRSDPVIAAPDPAMTFAGVVLAVRAIFGTYYGWNTAVYFCEEVTDPRRDIARATFVGIALVTAVYVLINIAYLHVLPVSAMAGSKLVAADAAVRVFGPSADAVVTAVSLISLITINNVTIMTFPRVLFAVARDSRAVPMLAEVAANGTPRNALITTVACGALLATVGVYEMLLGFASVLLAAMSVAVNLAAIVMRWREPELERPYRMPWFPLPALFALLVNLLLTLAFVYEDPVSTGWAAAIVAAAIPLYFLANNRRLAAGIG